jgi:dynein heavy chain 1
LHIWVEELDKRISEILIDRLEKRLKLWVKEFTNHVDDSETQYTMVEGMTLKIKMQNQNFILDPPLAHARAHLYTQLHKQVEIVCSVKKVEAQRFGRKGTSSKTYLSLVK